MKKLFLLAVLILFLVPSAGAGSHKQKIPASVPNNLSEQLTSLSIQHGFDLVIHAELEEVPAKPLDGDLLQLLELLLSAHNHVIMRSPGGKVDRVIVLSRKQSLPPAPDEIVLKLQRRGTHHLVQATLVGTNGAEIQADLLVDTGSTFVVLPQSRIADLGIAPDQLTERQVQTAKGRVVASISRVPSIRIGGEEISNVEVAFIEDSKLGGNSLLGMSILSRYKVILDDENSTLTLIVKD